MIIHCQTCPIVNILLRISIKHCMASLTNVYIHKYISYMASKNVIVYKGTKNASYGYLYIAMHKVDVNFKQPSNKICSYHSSK